MHITVVVIFLVIYLIKTFLLVTSSFHTLDNFRAKSKVIEMIVSTLFLLSGIYLWLNTGNTGTWLIVKVVCVLASIPLAVIGLKKRKKGLMIVSFLLLVFSYGLAEMKRLPWDKKVETTTVEQGADLGKAMYSQYCAACHGADGTKGASGAKDLSQSALSDDERIEIITNGKNTMSPYKDILSAEQIKAVSDYTASLKK